MNTTPTPAVMPQKRIAHAVTINPEALAVTGAVRPAIDTVEGTHDGVVKAKQLRPGQVVRSWLHGAPRGSEHTVESTQRSEDGSQVIVTFVEGHTNTYKAAYRFYDASLAGTTVRRTVRRFVPYHQEAGA